MLRPWEIAHIFQAFIIVLMFIVMYRAESCITNKKDEYYYYIGATWILTFFMIMTYGYLWYALRQVTKIEQQVIALAGGFFNKNNNINN